MLWNPRWRSIVSYIFQLWLTYLFVVLFYSWYRFLLESTSTIDSDPWELACTNWHDLKPMKIQTDVGSPTNSAETYWEWVVDMTLSNTPKVGICCLTASLDRPQEWDPYVHKKYKSGEMTCSLCDHVTFSAMPISEVPPRHAFSGPCNTNCEVFRNLRSFLSKHHKSRQVCD